MPDDWYLSTEFVHPKLDASIPSFSTIITSDSCKEKGKNFSALTGGRKEIK